MWYNKIVSGEGAGTGTSAIPDALAYYTAQLVEASGEVKLKGIIEKHAAALPGQLEYRYGQLQEIEAILEYVNIHLSKQRSLTIRTFMENYNSEMTVREAEKWIDAEDDVVFWKELVNEVAFIRNRYLGIMKGLEAKNFMLGHIVKLKVASLDDAEVF